MNLERVKYLVETVFEKDLTKRCRKREYVYPRFIFYKIAKEKVKASLTEIGNFIGYDHASVIHGIANIDYVLKKEKFYKIGYEEIMASIMENRAIKFMDAINLEKLKNVYLDEVMNIQKEANEKVQEIERKHIKQKKYYNELLELSEEQQMEFYYTRIIPYLKMNGKKKMVVNG